MLWPFFGSLAWLWLGWKSGKQGALIKGMVTVVYAWSVQCAPQEVSLGKVHRLIKPCAEVSVFPQLTCADLTLTCDGFDQFSGLGSDQADLWSPELLRGWVSQANDHQTRAGTCRMLQESGKSSFHLPTVPGPLSLSNRGFVCGALSNKVPFHFQVGALG